MKLKQGDKINSLALPSINGDIFNIKNISGKKTLVTFYRFATCPFCNLRIFELNKRYPELGTEFKIVAIFDSKIDNLKRFTLKHNAPFPILADEKYEYFSKYDVEKSFIRFLWSQIIRANRQFKGYFKGYLPIAFKGGITTMPVDVLINENGLVEKVKYAKDLSDHIPISELKEYSK